MEKQAEVKGGMRNGDDEKMRRNWKRGDPKPNIVERLKYTMMSFSAVYHSAQEK